MAYMLIDGSIAQYPAVCTSAARMVDLQDMHMWKTQSAEKYKQMISFIIEFKKTWKTIKFRNR